MLDHHRVTPSIKSCVYLFIHLGGERHCKLSKRSCSRTHNTMSSAGTRMPQIQTTQSGGNNIGVTAPPEHSAEYGKFFNFQGSLPTAEEETNTFGGFVASAIFLAKILVVSKRLFLNSSMNPSFHLLNVIKIPSILIC